MPAVIALDFEPVVRLGDLPVRLETLALAVSILLALLLAGWLARRTPAGYSEPGSTEDRLRIDDLVFIVLAILPGAVVGGRLGYVLLHLDFYRAQPAAILDPGQGSLELALAVVGGTVTGAFATRLLGEPVGRWLHVATVPLLVALTLGKVAQALGGSGQGAPSDVPWATSYLGSRTWASLAPDVPSHPAQLYEAAGAFLVLIAITWIVGRAPERRDARTFLTALVLWAVVRAIVATTWRDVPVAGPLNVEQLIAIGLFGVCLALIVIVSVRARARVSLSAEPDWPDPETRPHF